MKEPIKIGGLAQSMESPPEDVVTPLEITLQSMDGSASRTLAMGHEKKRSGAEPTGKPSEVIVECQFLNVAGAAVRGMGSTVAKRWRRHLGHPP